MMPRTRALIAAMSAQAQRRATTFVVRVDPWAGRPTRTWAAMLTAVGVVVGFAVGLLAFPGPVNFTASRSPARVPVPGMSTLAPKAELAPAVQCQNVPLNDSEPGPP